MRESPVSEADLTDGVKIEKTMTNGANDSLKPQVVGTNMVMKINPLMPKQSAQFVIQYSYILNKSSHVRTGEIDEGSYFIAYFFPRIAVYDDIDGWNKNPYNGLQEFYNDFCNFKVSVSVPKDYLVWATGNLLNCSGVLNSAVCQKIQQAENSDSVINIIDSNDVKQGNITTQKANVWKFEANDVSDFVFAVSNHYVWQSTSLVVDKKSGRRTRVDAVFNPKHTDYFNVIHYARETVKNMSFAFPAWAYPYPHETVFDGLDQMEYPMMVNDNPVDEKANEIELTDHEIFHTMFHFIWA